MSESSFEKLVMDMSSSERLTLLNKINASMTSEKQLTNTSDKNQVDAEDSDLSIKLKNESFFLKLLFRIKSFFTNTTLEFTYNKYLVGLIARDIESKSPSYLDPRTMELKEPFYEQIKKLKQVSEYFKMGCAIYEEDPGNFLVFMGSLIFTDMEERFEESANPYKYPFDQEIGVDLRATLIRHMEEIMQSVSTEQKARMYLCVQSLEWIRQFTHIPFDKILSKFRPTGRGDSICIIDSVQNELALLCKVMCSTKQIYTEVLESLFFLTYQGEHKKTEEAKVKNNIEDMYEAQLQEHKDNEEDKDLTLECNAYVEKSLEQISVIRAFMATVPILKLTKLAKNSSSWIPERLEGSEDWFIKFKSQWRKTFDKTWNNWLKDKNRYTVLTSVEQLYKCDDFPTIENRPWLTSWNGIDFSKEYSLGFLFAYFKKLYMGHARTLRVLATEGEFLKRENQLEFTEAFNGINRINISIMNLNAALAPNGSYGEIFSTTNVINERTIQNYSKITSLVATIESEAQTLAVQFKEYADSLCRVLGGILNPSKTSKYDTLANLATVQGGLNDKFRTNLVGMNEDLSTCIQLLGEIQNMEAN